MSSDNMISRLQTGVVVGLLGVGGWMYYKCGSEKQDYSLPTVLTCMSENLALSVANAGFELMGDVLSPITKAVTDYEWSQAQTRQAFPKKGDPCSKYMNFIMLYDTPSPGGFNAVANVEHQWYVKDYILEVYMRWITLTGGDESKCPFTLENLREWINRGADVTKETYVFGHM
jgi:hypothetical protein